MRFSPNMAKRGMVNSAITRMEATVRNLAYMGTWSMKKSVKGMKFFPHERRIDNMVATSSAHFSGPFTTNRLNTKRATTKAPT